MSIEDEFKIHSFFSNYVSLSPIPHLNTNPSIQIFQIHLSNSHLKNPNHSIQTISKGTTVATPKSPFRNIRVVKTVIKGKQYSTRR